MTAALKHAKAPSATEGAPVKTQVFLTLRADRLAPSELDQDRARRTWLAITGQRHGKVMSLLFKTPFYNVFARLRKTERLSDPLASLDCLIAKLAALPGDIVTEADCRLLEQHIGDTISICFAGTAQQSAEEIDVREQTLDGAEDVHQTMRLAARAAGRSVPAVQLFEEAKTKRAAAATLVESARALEREARRREAGLGLDAQP
jgi:hypothetical protein